MEGMSNEASSSCDMQTEDNRENNKNEDDNEMTNTKQLNMPDPPSIEAYNKQNLTHTHTFRILVSNLR